MQFLYRIEDNDVVVQVTSYQPERPMVITGTGFGDAEPPEHEEIEFDILGSDGLPWPQMQAKITPTDEKFILNMYKKIKGLK